MRNQGQEGFSSRGLSRIVLVGSLNFPSKAFQDVLCFVLYHIVPILISFGGEKQPPFSKSFHFKC